VFAKTGSDQAIYDIQPIGTQLIAVGFDGPDAAVWNSTDGGTTWKEIKGQKALGGAGQRVMTRLVQTGVIQSGVPAIVAGGFETLNGHESAALWYSQDGSAWTRETSSAAQLGNQTSQQINSVFAKGFPFVAVGFEVTAGDKNAAVWSVQGPTP
jgi:hypothetical protein